MVQEEKNTNSEFVHLREVREYFDTKKLDKSPLSIISFVSILDRFLNWVGVRTFEDIKSLDSSICGEYISYLKTEGNLKCSTINKHIRALKAIFSWWLLKRNYIKESPFAQIDFLKETKGKKIGYLKPDEAATFLAASRNIEQQFMFTLLIATGLRENEFVNIKLEDIVDLEDGSGGAITVIFGKGDRQRTVYMFDEVYNLYKKYLYWRSKKPYRANSEYLFVSKLEGRYSGHAIWDKMKALMKRAGFSEERIKELYVHSLRHTMISNNHREGIPVEITAEIVGHSDPKITQKIYTHIEQERIIEAMKNRRPINRQEN
jgi:integrase/recombinase XerD